MSTIAYRPGVFVAWLRQVRRSAWLLIGCCLIFRVGDALVTDVTLPAGGAPALAAEG